MKLFTTNYAGTSVLIDVDSEVVSHQQQQQLWVPPKSSFISSTV